MYFLSLVHCGSIRQTATIISMSVEHLRTGDRATVRFRFIKSPEYLRLGMKLVFREGRTKAIGSVSKLYPHVAPQTSNTRGKSRIQTGAAAANSATTDQLQPYKRNDSGEDGTLSGNKRPKQTKTTTAPTAATTTTTADTAPEQNIAVDKTTS